MAETPKRIAQARNVQETPRPLRKRTAFQAGFGALGWLAHRAKQAVCNLSWLPKSVEEPAEPFKPDVEQKAKVFLVVGECGDGKSTLINALRDPQRSGEASAGLASRGVTKSIEAYVGRPINGQPIDLLDTPGIGDTDITPMKVLTLIEQELVTDAVHATDSIDGVIVTTPIPDGRVKLGAQVVQMLVQHGFLGEGKWQNIILVGTKADRATPEELELFKTDAKDDKGQPMGIAGQFFSMAPGGKGTFVRTSKDDYSELRQAIAGLPDSKVQYGSPDAAKMAEIFSEKLGVEKDLFQKELEASRRELETQLSAQFEEMERQKKQMAEERDEMRRKQQQLQQDQEQQQSESRERQMQLEQKLEAQQRALAELQSPEQRTQLEEESRRSQQELQQIRAAQLLQQEQLQEKERDLRALLEQIRHLERASEQRARNYNFGKGGSIPGCLHPSSRRWGNAYGSGRKCTACKAELGPGK